jgi:translocation and assembly module TamB
MPDPIPVRDPSAAGAHAPPVRRRRLRRAVFAAVAVLALALAAGGAWLGTPAALEFGVAALAVRSGGRIVVTGVSGSLLSTMQAQRIVYRADDLVVTADDVALTWSPAALWSRAIEIGELRARRVLIEVRTATATALPASLALPIAVAVNRAAVAEFAIGDSDTARALTDIAFGYRGGAASHKFSDIALAGPMGRLSGGVTLSALPPYAVDGTLALAGSDLVRQATANVTLSGSLAALDVKAQGRAVGAALDAAATIAPFSARPLSRVVLAARGLDLAAFEPALPATALDVALTATTRADGPLEGNVVARNAIPGPMDASRLPVVTLATEFVVGGATVELSGFVADLGAAGKAHGGGRLSIAGNGVPDLAGSEWQLAVRDLDLALVHRQLVPTRLSGNIRATLAAAKQRVDAELTQSGIALNAVAEIAGDTVDIRQFRARAEGGELNGRGHLQLDGARHFDVTATAARLDPSRFGAFPEASLDGDIAVTGQLLPAWTANVTLVVAPTARLAGAPIAGTARFALDARTVRDAVVEATLAGARLRATGSYGRAGDRLDFSVDVPRVADVVAVAGNRVPASLRGATGRLQARGHLDGEPARPGLAFVAHGDALKLAAYALGTADVRGELAPARAATDVATALLDRAVTLEVAATRLTTPAGKYAGAGMRVAGTLARHEATFTLAGDEIDLHAKLGGGLVAGHETTALSAWTWSGALLEFENRGTNAVRLAAPASVDIGRETLRVGAAVLRLAEGSFRVDALAWEQGRVTTQGAFADLPLETVARLAGTALPLRSTVMLSGAWNVAAAPRLNGKLMVRRERGDLYVSAPGARDAGEIALGVEGFEATALFDDDAVSARLMFAAGRLGRTEATLALGVAAGAEPGRIAADAPLKATVNADLASLRALQPWIGTVASLDGRVRVDLAASGTRARAPITGTITAENLTLDAPQYGMHWSGGTVRARVVDNVVTLDEFAFASGAGRFTVSGTLQAPRPGADGTASGDPGARLAWRAENFRAFNQPDLRLVVDGQGTIAFAGRTLALSGSLRAVEGHIEFAKSRAGRLGDDVIVAGRPKPGAGKNGTAAPIGFALDLELDAGTNLSVLAQGLETVIEGRVRITTAADGALIAKGSIVTVRGIYQAFGQRLVITRGRLIFDGPVDNPALDFVALRQNLAVEAGVEVTGTVKLPHVRLTSEPPVPDNEKLAWLVLGRGLDRTSGGDVAALQAAAAAVFGQGGAPLGSTVAQRVGLDDLAFRTGTATGATTGGSGTFGGVSGGVVAFGKRISDKVYLVYEQGLTVANNALKIEYALTRNVRLRAEAGVVSGFGIYYTRSFE